MQNRLLNKLVLVIILCVLVGATASGTLQEKTVENIAELYEFTDWWPMYRHDPVHTGYSTSDAPDTNHTCWEFTTDDDVLSSPAIYDNRLYVGSNDYTLYCINAETGSELWSYVTGDAIISSPTIEGDYVYFASTDGYVYCLNRITASEQWITYLSWVVSSPTVVNGKVFIGSGDEYMYCLDANTGAIIWSYDCDFLIQASPAVVNNRVYIGTGQYNDGGILYCLDANTGEHIWNKSLGIIQSSATVVNDKVYVGYSSREMTYGGVKCLDAYTGSVIWTHPTDHIILLSSPAYYHHNIYIGCHDHHIYCLNANTGNVVWSHPANLGFESSPAIADDKLYIGCLDNNTYCLNATTGNLIWKYTTGSYIMSSPAVADSRVYIGSSDNKIYCFNDSTENQPPDAPTITGPDKICKDVSYIWTFSATDPENEIVQLFIDWGDTSQDTWYGPYASGEPVELSHTYEAKGDYIIRAKAKDIHDAESAWGKLQIAVPTNKISDINTPIFTWLSNTVPKLYTILLKIIT